MNKGEEMENTLTKEEAEKLYNSTRKPELMFNSYYKFTFTFVGENEKYDLTVRYGGNSDDIYKYDVDPQPIKAPDDFDKLMREYYEIRLTEKATGKVFEDYHYH